MGHDSSDGSRHIFLPPLLSKQEDLLERYESMQRAGMKVGDSWPCIRTTRSIAINEELIVRGYGSGFWLRFDREAHWDRCSQPLQLYRLSFLQPRLVAWLQERQRMAAGGERRRRKRVLEEASEDAAASTTEHRKRRRLDLSLRREEDDS